MAEADAPHPRAPRASLGPRVTRVDLALEPAPRAAPSALVIGNFDGVHRGHAAVLAQMGALAAERGLSPAVLTFEPHPAVVLGRPAPPLLTTVARKVALFGRHGVAEVFVARFSSAFAETPPERFLDDLVFGALGARVVVVGDNFRFGKARAGDFAFLARSALARGLGAYASVLASDAEGPLSSTRIRGLVAAGNMQSAAELLGRPHALSGVVARGAQRGRTIGFPTANLSEVPELLPANGVYAVSVDLLDAPDGPPSRALGHGVMNVGTRPTVSDGSPERHVEVHLFDVSLDLYGRPLRVHVRDRVRDERKFESFEALREQIVRDAATARALTAATPVPASGGFDPES